MKNIIIITSLLFLLASCGTAVKFPVSDVAPAADITATVKKDKQNNYAIKVTADNLASVERLSPPMETYVVWIVTSENGINNIGQLQNKNAKKATLKTLSVHQPLEIFITAESDGTVSYPSGVEIARSYSIKSAD